MIKYILLLIFISSTTLSAQSLYQNPLLDFLGSNLADIGLKDHTPFLYNGMGKRLLLENHPITWSGGMTTTYSPKSNIPFLFGALTPHRCYNYQSPIEISGSHFGEVDITAKTHLNRNKWLNQTSINGHFFNNRIDENKDNFLDLPLKNRFLFKQTTAYRAKNWTSRLSAFFMHLEEQGGQSDFRKDLNKLSDSVYGFGKSVQHAGIYFYNTVHLNGKNQKNPKKLIANIAGRLHRQDSYFGQQAFLADEETLEAFIAYHQGNALENWQIGGRYQFQNGQERLVPFRLEQEFSTIGLFMSYQRFLNEKWLIRAALNVDHHNELDWEIHPSLKINYQGGENWKLGIFAGSGYQYESVLSQNDQMLIGSRVVRLDELGFSKANYIGGAFSIKLNEVFHFNNELQWKTQYYFRQYDSRNQFDLDTDATEVRFYHSEDNAFRSSLESSLFFKHYNNVGINLVYRCDIAKSTFGEQKLQLPFHSNHNLFLLGHINLTEFLGLQTNYLYRSRQRLPNLSDQSPHTHRLDLFVNFSLKQIAKNSTWQKFTFFVGAENIFNQKQDDFYSFAATPFSQNFDSTQRWGRPVGIRIWSGVRFTPRR